MNLKAKQGFHKDERDGVSLDKKGEFIMQFNFNFEAFEQSGKEKNEAINYLKSLNSSIDFDKLEQENKGDENAIYEALKGGNFSFSKPSIEQTRQKLLKNKENEALKAEFNAGLSWLGEEKKQNFNFYDFKKAKEKANSKQGLIEADLKEKEKQMQKKEALFETRLKERGIIAKSFDDMLDQSGAYLGADLLEKGLNKLGFKDENYIFESEKEDIKSRALKSVREKLERGDLEFNEREKHALRSKYDEPDYKKALQKEKERLRLSQKSGNFSEAEREFIENDLGFFNTLFNDDKENIKEFKEKVKSEGVISSEIIKAANTLKAFDEGNLFKNMLFADEKEKKEFQQNFLNDAYKIAELSGFDDVGLDKKGELYFIKDEQKYLVNTGFFDNFAQLLNDTKFEFAGGVLGGLKGFNSGKSAKGKVAKSILGAAAGSFGGAFLDAKIADMYLNRESDFKKNLDFAIQAGLLSMAGDGVILSVKPLAKGLYKGVKKGGEILGEYSILGTLKTLPQQNIQAAEKIINEVFSPKMKEELKAAQEEFGGSVRGEDLKNAFFANLQKKFTQKYGENDSKTKSVAKIAEIFNTNSLKTRQQAMLDLVRSDTHGSTLAYLLEIAKDDVKIQSNLKNMLNLASSNVEKNLKNLNINAREIKHILDEFEAGNKAAFKEVENQIARLYDENYRVVLSKGEYENIKEEFRQNGVNLEEMTPFLRDLEANVFNENGVTFTQLNNFRKNLNFYIFNKDKTPNFINTLKKIGENILKNEIDKGIDNIFSQNKAAYESIKELYSTSLKDYATLKSLNESIKNLKLQDSAKSADEVLNSLIKYAKGQGEKGVNNLQKIKDYLGEENNAFLEMQILNKLFKESVVENDRAGVRVFDSESFLSRVRELVGENELYARKIGKEFLEELSPSAMPKQISIDEFLNTLENFKNKENFLKHIEKDPKRKDYLNLIEPTLKEPDIAFKKLENGVEKEKFIKKFSDGKDFFYLLATKDNKETILTAFKTDKINTILKEFNTDIIPTFIRQGSKGKAAGTTNEGIITQPLFKSKEAREFLELVEGFHKLYKNDASIAKNLVQGTSEKLSTSIATSAEGAIKQKVVKGAFDPIFRLLPDKILFGLFSKQIQGGALRYHLKKALSRSLNYDDFKIKLEKELKRTNFNSNTSRLIDEFMQNLDTFNAEKEAKLAKIREEQARIKEEERKRAEEIYQAQEANNLKDILEAEEKPLKDEFGVNFEGFKGKEAIEKLLEEQRGQVRGAFYKEGLGEIDLVWGDKNYGLEHILNKHGGEFKNLARELSEAVENGKIVKDDKGRLRLEYENKIVGIKDNWKGEKTAHWVVTAYVKKEKEASLYTSASFTKGEALPLNSKESIAQNAKSERAEFESFKDKIKELYTKYEGLSPYDKSTSQLRSKLLNEEIKPEIKKEFKNIIDKFKGADNKDKILRVIKENKEELSDYLAFNIALRKDIYIDGRGEGRYDFYDKSIRGLFKLRENKPGSEIGDDSNYRALAALENLSNKNTSLYFSFRDLNGKVGEFKTYPRIQDLLFYDLTLGYDFKNPMILSTKDKHLKEKLIEKLKAYIDKKIYADFLEYKIKDLESRNPKNSYFENYKDEKWDEEALKSFKKELEDLRANEKAQKLEAKGSEDITDKKGKEHTLTKETQKAWLEAFNLKSLDEAYIPNLPRELKEALGKEIKLTKGSLYKIVEKGREKYIPQMKQTLQNPDFALRDRDNMLILAKQIEDKQYFTSVNLETKDYFISVSNAPKKENILKNKVENGAEILYQSPNAKSIFYTDTLLQTDKSSANKIDEDIIAQNAKSESEKEVLERQIPFIEAEIQKYEAKIASLDERIKKTQTRIQPYLDEINALQKQYDELYFTETRGEEANAKKWLKLEEIKAKQEELRKPYNDALFKFVFPHQRLKGKVQTEIQKLKFGLQDRALRLEEIQNEALNTSKAQKAWLEAFGLKSLEEAYIPNFKAEVKEAINRVLGGEEIKLTKGSLIKLIKEKRLKYLDRIKPTLENPHSVILQNDGALIFARDYGEEKYFTSVARNDSGEWIIRSNAPKSKNGLNNKILNGGKEIYNDQAASQINASNPYDDIANSNIKLDNESIAQNADYLELVKEYGEENAKRIIKQKILSENIAQVLENEEEKFIYKKGDREFEFKIKDAMGQFEMQYDELNLKSDLNKSFLKALNKLKIGYEVLENEPVRIRYFKQEAKERKPKETKPSADKTLGQIQKDMSARLKELKAQAKENYERYKNEDKALQKELTNTKDLFKAFEKEFNETEGTILISRAKRRKNDAEGKVETSVFLGNELALRNALDRWERYSGYSEENALEVKERLELLRSYVKRLEKHREDIKAKREQLEQDYQQNEAARSKEMGVIGNYNILSNLKGVSENELYEPFLEKVGGYLSKADFYERHLPFVREEFQKLFNITPLKEFGTNYAEFYRDGKGAVEKLLAEKQGQVAGAFYKEGLGEIDLVWGDSKKGLSHILERRTQDFINQGLEKGKAEYKVRELLSEIPQILENGKILSQNNDKIELITDKYTLVLGLREDKKFIVTELIDKRNKKRLEAMQTGVGDSFTDEPLAKTPLSQNQQEIIPQQKIKFAMEKFHYDENKAKDLLEWHKNSHALTKDENGLPKVFYHGTYSKFRVFRRVGKASGQGFFFTPSQKATEEYGDITLNAFLNIKNPFRADELKINKEADLQKWADILKLDYDKEKYESFKDLKTKLEKVKEATKKAGFKFHSANSRGVYVIDNKGRNSFINLNELDKENKRVVEAFKGLETEDIYFYYVVRNEFDLVLYALNKNDRYFHTSGRDEVKRVLEKLGYDGVVLNDTIITVFNSNQIKHIDNKGSFTDTKGNVTSKKPKDKEAEFSYFNEKSDNIYHSNPHLGAGLVGGTLNGVEQDENGNLSFDPVKFAMGFLGGAAGSKAVKESIKWRANKVKKAYPNIAKNNPALMEQIAKRDLLTYAKNETQNALTRLLNKNKLFDSTKGLFAGEKALLNEAYAPHKARLEKAKELEGSGADEIEIWEKTGWYKDKDHKWKFEISQRGGELDLAKIKDKDSEAKLGEILKDDELFKAYPQLRDMSVKHVDLSGNYGFYYVPYNDIKLVRPHIQLDIDEIKTSPYKVKEVLYHEIQHAIQHKEQFAYGLSYMAETYERYLKQHGEVEARNIQERMKNPTKIHPHKTMDTDIEDTIAESTLNTEYSEAFSRKLEKSFLDESGRIAYKSLMQNAEKLPKELQREQKGLYNVAFNGKNASLIKQDLQSVESAIAFMQGTRYKGAKHERIKHLTDPSKEGYVTDLEFVNLGKSIREFLKNYEPFIDTNGARLYEWENKDKVRFRVVVNDVADMDSNPTTATEEIITFYSDRNLKEKMNFKNPLLKDTIAESTMQGEALSKELESKEANTHTLREQTKELLKPFTHKLIKNKNDNTKAIVTMSGIKEMLSAKAINQSVKNGFKAKQHIKAVMALPTLFENAVFKDKQAQRHFKDYVEAYRVYSADFEGGKAIISVQERKIGNDVLYFLKLDELRLNNA
ncbi:PBECR2 nuclease fold domain-containing protein [Campylobacter upsaliensis]